MVDEERGLIRAHGKELVLLREARNPKDIPWRDYGVELVVECTGKFRDPHAEADARQRRPPRPPGGGRPHRRPELALQEQAEGSCRFPDDAAMLIHGINHFQFDPAQHKLVSAASCTTTALAHMMRPLLDRDLTKNMITAGMSTVHAVTNSQPALDAVPAAGAKDMRKSRGALGNIVLTSTNAAAALEQVMPEISRIGFMADSVRIPTATVSLIILNVTFQSEANPDGTVTVERDAINAIYREAAEGEAKGLLKYTDEQNVSADMIGEDAAVVIEGAETHTRTGFVDLRMPAAKPGTATARRSRCRSPTSRSSAGTTTRWAATRTAWASSRRSSRAACEKPAPQPPARRPARPAAAGGGSGPTG